MDTIEPVADPPPEQRPWRRLADTGELEAADLANPAAPWMQED